MSYERAIEQWKAETADTPPPPLQRIEQLHRAGADPAVIEAGRAIVVRAWMSLVVLGFASMAVYEWFWLADYRRSGRGFAVALPIGALLLAMSWLREHDLARQMMVRALVWSTLVIGTIISVFGLSRFSLFGLPIALGSGVALLMMGNRGLGVTSRSFAPVAYRNHLQLALVLATADAGTLLFAAAMQIGMSIQKGVIGYLWLGLPTLVCGLVMAVAVTGIYRLRTWALVLNLLANLAIAYVAMSGYLGLTIPVATALAATATMQLLLPVPILAAALGDPLQDRSPLGRLGGRLLKVGLIAMTVLGVLGPATNQGYYSLARPGWVEGVHRTWVRGLAPVDVPLSKHRGVPRRTGP